MRSRYNLMKESEQTNSKGVTYPDVMTIPFSRFYVLNTSKEYVLKQTDIDRIDLLIWREYGVTYYDDLILWLNKIDCLHNLEPGETIYLPSKEDLDRFFVKYMR